VVGEKHFLMRKAGKDGRKFEKNGLNCKEKKKRKKGRVGEGGGGGGGGGGGRWETPTPHPHPPYSPTDIQHGQNLNLLVSIHTQTRSNICLASRIFQCVSE
jgi:hypothetical protein